MSDTDGPVHFSGSIHIQAMKVQTCAFVTELIVDIDNDPVALCSDDCRKRPLAINAHDGPRESTIWICEDPRYIEVISDSRCVHCETVVKENQRNERLKSVHRGGVGRSRAHETRVVEDLDVYVKRFGAESVTFPIDKIK